MIKNLYVIKDMVTGQFGNPFPCVNEASAIRYFDKTATESGFASDLQLFSFGVFNIESGEFTSKLEFIKGGV